MTSIKMLVAVLMMIAFEIKTSMLVLLCLAAAFLAARFA
jgi:hypothetical protein